MIEKLTEKELKITQEITNIENKIKNLKESLKILQENTNITNINSILFGKLLTLKNEKYFIDEKGNVLRVKENHFEQPSKEEIKEVKALSNSIKVNAVKIGKKIYKTDIKQIEREIETIKQLQNLSQEKSKLLSKKQKIEKQIERLFNLYEKDIIKTLNLKEEDIRILKRAIEFRLINIPYPTNKIEEIPVILSYVKDLKYTKELYDELLKDLGVKKNWIKDLEEAKIIQPEMEVLIKIKKQYVKAKLWNIKTIQEKKEEILKFIQEKQENIQKSKELTRQKIKERLSQIHQELKVKKEVTKEMLKILKLYNPVLVVMFYLYHLNHYAKTEKYEKYKDEIYELKKEALIKAYKENPDLFSLYFIPRGDKIIYCDECREIAYENWKYAGGYKETGYSFGEWLKEEEPCPNCEVIKDYYSLVEFNIKTEIVNFSFHLPYPEVENIFNKKNLKEKYIENAESIKFGRGLEGYEALIVTLKTALKKVKEYVEKTIK
ncbi:MAG: hypothetical protein ACK4FM_00525 [Caldimicrobium sp.]